LREQRRTYLVKDLNLLTKNINEQKIVLLSTLAFFLIEEQLSELIPEGSKSEVGQPVLQNQFLEKLSAHLLDTCRFGYSPRDILVMKKTLHYCAVVSKLKQAPALENMYLESKK
jgi:hypothetical protein